MLRTTTLSAAALLGLALLAPTQATAAPTCQGQAVTVDGTGAAAVNGTEGDDVIFSDNATAVNALGGDDLICIGGHTSPFVNAGAGNDVVDATAALGGTSTILGDGDDTYLGSAASDDVVAGATSNRDTGRDVIDTGGRGARSDVVDSGEGGRSNPDQIRGGWMRLEWMGFAALGSRADGGEGSLFEMSYPNTPRNLSIDIETGYLMAGSYYRLELSGFTDFYVRGYRQLRTFTFTGSDRDEHVSVWNTSRRTRLRIAAGGGDDAVEIGDFARRSRFSGGDGRDYIYPASRSRIGLDLGREHLTAGAGGKAVHAPANGFEDAIVTSPAVTLTGTARHNTFEVSACRATVLGLGGRDRISAATGAWGIKHIECPQRRMRFLGGPGGDVLAGSKGPDVLIGGPGRDTADGSLGRDACEAEKVHHCEVRR
jgi:hypothetical protein